MSAPTKPYVFSNTPSGTNVIDATQVNADFDALYAYLTANQTQIERVAPAMLATLAARGSGTVACSNAVPTTITFPTEDIDQGGNFAAGIFTAPYAGIYRFETVVNLSTSIAGHITMVLTASGAGGTRTLSAIGTTLDVQASTYMQLAAGETVKIIATNSGPSPENVLPKYFNAQMVAQIP
jgi:hypothetical protein